jgi:hypothetical protein
MSLVVLRNRREYAINNKNLTVIAPTLGEVNDMDRRYWQFQVVLPLVA